MVPGPPHILVSEDAQVPGIKWYSGHHLTLLIQRLRFYASTAEGMGSIPGGELRFHMLHSMSLPLKKKKKWKNLLQTTQSSLLLIGSSKIHKKGSFQNESFLFFKNGVAFAYNLHTPPVYFKSPLDCI